MSAPTVIALAFSDYKVFNKHGKKKSSASCNKCKKLVEETGSTTTNYLRHLRTSHKDIYKSYVENKDKLSTSPSQSELLSFFGDKYKPTELRQQLLSKSLALNLVVDCAMPLSVVERNGFKRFMRDVDRRYSMASRTKITSIIDQEVDTIQQTIKEALKDQQSLSLTMDIWSDKKMRGFLGVTVHYYKDSGHGYELTSSNLKTARFIGSHTGERIRQLCMTVMSEYNLENRVHYIITDNASNMKKAFTISFPDDLQAEVDDEELWEDLQWLNLNVEDADVLETFSIEAKRLSCFAHSLQLAIGAGLAEAKGLSATLSKATKLANQLHSSTAFKEAFEEEFGTQCGIPQRNCTRWNSTLRQTKALLDRGLQGLTRICTNQHKTECIFTKTQWIMLEELVTVLEPFREATDITQSDKVVTISAVIPYVLNLYKHVTTVSNQLTSEAVIKIARVLRDQLMKRFEGIFTNLKLGNSIDLSKAPFNSNVYMAATLLDPNYALFWVDEEILSSKEHKEQLKGELKEMVCSWATELPVNIEETQEEQPSETDSTSSQSQIKRSRVGNYRSRRSISRIGDSVLSATAQMSKYLHYEFNDATQINPIQFWLKSQKLMPHLSRLAIQVLTIPATSAPVERVFSHGGIIMRPHRSSLSDQNLSNLIFLKCNRLDLV